LADLHPARIAERRDVLLAKGLAPATVRRYLATLASALTAAVQMFHWLPASPMRGVHQPSERGSQRNRFLSEDELGRLVAACHQSESPDLLLAVLLAVGTGARQGEVLALRWRDVDWARKLVLLRQGVDSATKGGARGAALGAAVAPLLRARYEAGRARALLRGLALEELEGELIFPSRVSRSRPVCLRRPFMTALRRAGIEGFVWHDLRHSAASFLAADGASLLEIGAVLGHRSANTTKRYSHLVEGHVHDLTRAMADRVLLPTAADDVNRGRKGAEKASPGPNSTKALGDEDGRV
jgi:integrase